MNTNQPSPTPLSSAEMIRHRDQVVSSLAATADSLSGSLRRRLMRLADYLAFCDRIESVLGQPMLLEIYLGLREKNDPTQRDIDEVVQRAVTRAWQQRFTGTPWWSSLLYPAMILGISGLVLIGACWLVVPVFERMFDEFGLLLPLPTVAIIGLSHWILSPWLYLAGLLLAACVFAFVWMISGNERRADTPPKWLGSAFDSTRKVWADWAWHLSLLLQSGQPESTAIAIAGSATGRRWLRSGSAAWADRVHRGEQPFAGITHFRGQSCHLLSSAFDLDASTDDKAAMLRGVAEVYWDRDRLRSRWQLGWLSPLMVVSVGFIVWFILIALFMPLINLISGLS
ncbi:type II secretion system F family protein [Neorhodopirellula pilleata]|uniref:Type IV pilin biogenesis protein n=1 Tax=Neorhodopirellula pilleata TaxID=2714738 RepID=A0A5C6A6W5_9BACT|nr:type II secretion system F family protein [Neorhodopirellula pilleata]TWT95028.1 type IV pilin biogenesis protein [Neorhodopirellula pilleata]